MNCNNCYKSNKGLATKRGFSNNYSNYSDPIHNSTSSVNNNSNGSVNNNSNGSVNNNSNFGSNIADPSSNSNSGANTRDQYFKCDHHYNNATETHTNNHYSRNNHHTTTNHYYVKDNYYVNDFHYNKDVYHYDRDVVQKSYDCGTETVIDPNNNCSKPTPYHTECIEDHYDEVNECDFKTTFKCRGCSCK